MIWSQHWSDVLFLHFGANAAELERLLPPQVEADLYAGRAWVSYVLFRLRLRPSWLPPVPGLSSLVELNVRTYVRHRGQPGICFFGLHADNRLAVRAARLLTPLPYAVARIGYEPLPERKWRAECRSTKSPDHRVALHFCLTEAPRPLEPRSFDAWLLERYRLYIGTGGGALLAADVEHPPWQASPVVASVSANTLAFAHGLVLNAAPEAAHFSPGVRARFGPFRQVAGPFAFTSPQAPPGRGDGLDGGRRRRRTCLPAARR
jgi:hypothetical protein